MLTPAQQEAISSQHQQVRSLAIYEPHPLHALSVHIQQCHSEISRMFCSYCTVHVYTAKQL